MIGDGMGYDKAGITAGPLKFKSQHISLAMQICC